MWFQNTAGMLSKWGLAGAKPDLKTWPGLPERSVSKRLNSIGRPPPKSPTSRLTAWALAIGRGRRISTNLGIFGGPAPVWPTSSKQNATGCDLFPFTRFVLVSKTLLIPKYYQIISYSNFVWWCVFCVLFFHTSSSLNSPPAHFFIFLRPLPAKTQRFHWRWHHGDSIRGNGWKWGIPFRENHDWAVD